MPHCNLHAIFSTNTHFVPFNKHSNKGCGRNVYIDAALIPRYIELTTSKAVTPMRLSHAIQALRALAGGFSSASNLHNAFSHRSAVDGVEIAYTLLQGGKDREGGVYVTDLRLKANAKNVGEAGLHNVRVRRGEWVSLPAKDLSLSTFYGVISSGTAGLNGEASLKDATLDCGDYLAKNTRCDGGFDLFFSPASKVDGEGTWLTASQKRLPASSLAKNLADVIQLAEKQARWGGTVTWYVLDDGAKVLLQALKMLPAKGVKKLEKQTFMFSNARESMGLLKLALHNVGVTLTPDMIKTNSFDTAAVVHQKFALQHGLTINNHNRLGASARTTQLAANKDLLKKIDSFEDAVKNQLLNAAHGWC